MQQRSHSPSAGTTFAVSFRCFRFDFHPGDRPWVANGRGPKSADDLKQYLEGKVQLVKDVNDGVYVLFMNVQFAQLTGGTSNTILGYVHDVPTKGGVVLFADRSVRQMNVAEFQAAPKAGK